MNARNIRKEIFKALDPAVTAAVEAFVVEQTAKLEAARLESEAKLLEAKTSYQTKLDALAAKKAASPGRAVKAPKIVTAKRGAPSGPQPCQIFPQLVSKGPRFAYLSAEAHTLIYTGRTADEAKALVAAVLASRAAGTTHEADPGTASPEGATSALYETALAAAQAASVPVAAKPVTAPEAQTETQTEAAPLPPAPEASETARLESDKIADEFLFGNEPTTPGYALPTLL